MKGEGLDLGCRQVGVGKVTAGFTPRQQMLCLPADNPCKGTEGTRGNIGAKHSDKAKQTGPGYHFWQAIKARHPPAQWVFRKPLLVCSWSHGQNTILLPPFAPSHPWPLDIEGVFGGL